MGNLRLLSLTVASSQRTMCVSESDISLNRNQQQLIALAARSVLLFVIAIFTGQFLSVVCAFAFSISSGVRDIFFGMDCTINLLCVYLQFSFAEEHYQRCCGRLDG